MSEKWKDICLFHSSTRIPLLAFNGFLSVCLYSLTSFYVDSIHSFQLYWNSFKFNGDRAFLIQNCHWKSKKSWPFLYRRGSKSFCSTLRLHSLRTGDLHNECLGLCGGERICTMCSNGSKNVLRLNIQRHRSIPNGNMKNRYVLDWTLMRFKFFMTSITKCPHWWKVTKTQKILSNI